MRKITRRPRRYHDDLSDLPLFAWANRMSAPALTMGGYWVSRRTGLPPRIANTVADLAGIGIPYRN